MNIKLFYNVPWYMHHNILEAKDNRSAEGRRAGWGEDGMGQGAECSVKNFVSEFLVKQN